MDGSTQDAAQTPDLLVLLYFLYSHVLAPFRDGEERQVPESSSDQTLSGENTKDAEGTQHPFSPRCGWYYIIRMRNSSLSEKLTQTPPAAFRATPRYVLGRSTAARPPPSAPRPPRLLSAPAYVWERMWEARPCRRLDGPGRCAKGQRSSLSSMACPILVPGSSQNFSGIGRMRKGWSGLGCWGNEMICYGATVSQVPSLKLWGVKLFRVEWEKTSEVAV